MEGFFDEYTYEDMTDDQKKEIVSHRRKMSKKVGSKYIYQFIMVPTAGFLHENKPLPPNVELKLSFDRLAAEFSTLLVDASGDPSGDPLRGTVLDLKDVYAQVEYVSSPHWRSYFDHISDKPVSYNFDECNVLYKTLPMEEQTIRLDNIKGGNTPDYIFMAIAKTDSISGNLALSSVNFNFGKIKEINLTLNGMSCHGYPMRIDHEYPIWPYFKFYDTIGRLLNVEGANQQSLDTFKKNIIYAHKFEGEESVQGNHNNNNNTVQTIPKSLQKKKFSKTVAIYNFLKNSNFRLIEFAFFTHIFSRLVRCEHNAIRSWWVGQITYIK